jgi:transposase InsO family protein
VYYKIAGAISGIISKKRGPKPQQDDVTIVELLKDIIDERCKLGIHGEGYRKLRAILRFGSDTREPIRVSEERLRRIMREHNLLSAYRSSARRKKRHDGQITTDRPDELWGTDMTSTELTNGHKGNVFAVIDHCTQECIGVSVSDDATRFSAIEPVRMAVEFVYGNCEENCALGTRLRHDCGSAYLSNYFQDEIEFIGVESSPAFVREPQGNGVVERFFRTLKEQLLWIYRFETIEDLRSAVTQWVNTYNSYWMVAKHGYKSPSEIRAEFALQKAA